MDVLSGHCCLPTIGKIAIQNTAVNIHWIQECFLAEKCKRHSQKASVQHGCILFSKFNDFLFPSEKTEKSKFEPLLEVWGHNYIVRNTMRKVGVPVKIRGQPSPYDDPFWRYLFLLFLPKFHYNPPNRAPNHLTHQHFFLEQLKPSRGYLRGARTTIRILP